MQLRKIHTAPGDDGFADISFAAIVPKGRAARLAYVNDFVEDAKASGLVKRIIESEKPGPAIVHVCLWHKADIGPSPGNVRFWG
jgi:hypothetical protein